MNLRSETVWITTGLAVGLAALGHGVEAIAQSTPTQPAIQLSEQVKFNPPPLDASTLLEPQPPIATCPGGLQALLPLQGGGLSHQGLPPLYFASLASDSPAASVEVAKGATSEAGGAIAKPVTLTLQRAGQPLQNVAMALTPAPLPGYWHLSPAQETVAQETVAQETVAQETVAQETAAQETAAQDIALQAGERYAWTVTIPCPNSAEPQRLGGWVKPVTLPPELAAIATAASTSDRVKLYGQFGLWYDAVAAAFELPPAEQQAALGLCWGLCWGSLDRKAEVSGPAASRPHPPAPSPPKNTTAGRRGDGSEPLSLPGRGVGVRAAKLKPQSTRSISQSE
ncbi:MAG: DUF928 domain-containing protein [Synechococcales cyanobacterium RM1_1_8]|nr:DUF928 domain-containing protein [Synechococcales cyanobacterium RM1_1_8]